MTDYVLTGLVNRRATRTGEIEALHARHKVLLADLEALNATCGRRLNPWPRAI